MDEMVHACIMSHPQCAESNNAASHALLRTQFNNAPCASITVALISDSLFFG